MTYYDNDGNGLCYERVDVVIPNNDGHNERGKVLVLPNVVANNGVDVNVFTETTVFNNRSNLKWKIQQILNNKKVNNVCIIV